MKFYTLLNGHIRKLLKKYLTISHVISLDILPKYLRADSHFNTALTTKGNSNSVGSLATPET